MSFDSSSQSQGGNGNEDDPNDANLRCVFAEVFVLVYGYLNVLPRDVPLRPSALLKLFIVGGFHVINMCSYFMTSAFLQHHFTSESQLLPEAGKLIPKIHYFTS
ncbi:hypothetical protein PIB30_095008 [Stylosanthes scabra]|uniref:Uncharacterized protein n=1 Tax=Stylosanthes scabra TaxID=79078 RepID=A0ABU6WYB6_9FABA|nr:hypothetical protein [Stylosanthes scabra]